MVTPDERAALREAAMRIPGNGTVNLLPGILVRLLDALDAETARANAAEARYESLKGRTVGPYPEDACYETHAYFTPCAACERDEARAEAAKWLGELVDRDDALDRVRSLIEEGKHANVVLLLRAIDGATDDTGAGTVTAGDAASQGEAGADAAPVSPTIDPITHDPCCSSHGKALTCAQYRRSHFVEVRPCCAHDARALDGGS